MKKYESVRNRDKMDVYRINNDVNGNPRYVAHFFEFLTKEEAQNNSIENGYLLATNKARSLVGGAKYRGKSFGGGIVWSSYNIEKDIEKILEAQNA